MSVSRGQAAVEYLMVVSLLLLMVGYLSYNVLYSAQSPLEMNSGNDAVDAVAKAADTVYSLGPCSRTYVNIVIPDSVSGSSVGNRLIGLKIKTPAGVSEAITPTLGDPRGYLPKRGGGYKVTVEYTCSGVLVIGGGLSVKPSEIRMNIPSGMSELVQLNLTNNIDEAISGITYHGNGEVEPWTILSGAASSIAAGQMVSFNATFSPPASAPTGIYMGYIVVNASSGYVEVPVILNVSGILPPSSTTSSSTTATSASSTSTAPTTSVTTSSTSYSTTTSLPASCESYCKGLSYGGGECRQNPTQCSHNGEVNPIGGDAYCPDPPLKTCCCGIGVTSTTASTTTSASTTILATTSSTTVTTTTYSPSSTTATTTTTTTTTLVAKIAPQSCQAAIKEKSPGSFTDSCSGTYPAACPMDRVSCNDLIAEDKLASSNEYCGIKLRYSDASVTGCRRIARVDACFKWRTNAPSPSNCSVSASSDGVSWVLASDTCFGTYPGVTCVDVTSQASWSCGTFFGPSASGAYLRQNAMMAPGNHDCQVDVLYYNVIYS
jgi:hypothetical protein